MSDADDFNNWDLIGFQNANAFPSLRALLALAKCTSSTPSRFPIYNTGAESVLSILLHRAMRDVSLYWSNTAVLVVYDAIFLLGLGRLLRLVFRDELLECIAWMLVAMSPVVLTFASVSAFDMQAYATITLALLGCEFVLQSRPAPGLTLLFLAFLFISQAYPLTFFLPVFCGAWLEAEASCIWHWRSMAPSRGSSQRGAAGGRARRMRRDSAVRFAGNIPRQGVHVVADPFRPQSGFRSRAIVGEGVRVASFVALLPRRASHAQVQRGAGVCAPGCSRGPGRAGRPRIRVCVRVRREERRRRGFARHERS